MSDGCTESELPTCNVCACQNDVCLENPSCCDVAWDAQCVAACGASDQDCGSSGCEASALPGCDGCECETCVCEGDPTCCELAWDASCAEACGECGQACSSDGCVPSEDAGCNGCACEACVCAEDASCCDLAWDESCAQACDLCDGGCGFACGNGVLEPGEACDEGLANSDTVTDACRTTCVLATCGDGVVDSGENCDDTNLTDGDGCDSACAYENVAQPVEGSLVISEIMYNPQVVFDDQGEWFEVANLSEEIVDLNGLLISNAVGETHLVDSGAPLYLLPGEFAVFGPLDDLTVNGGVSLDYAYGEY